MEGNRSIRCFHGKIKANLGDKEKVYRTHFSYALWWECFPRVQVCACLCPCASKVRNGIPIKKQKGEKWNQCSITLGVYFYNLQKKFSTSTPHHVVFSLHTPHTDPPPIYDTLPPLLPNSCNLTATATASGMFLVFSKLIRKNEKRWVLSYFQIEEKWQCN